MEESSTSISPDRKRVIVHPLNIEPRQGYVKFKLVLTTEPYEYRTRRAPMVYWFARDATKHIFILTTRRMTTKLLRTAAQLVALSFICSSEARAQYVDPGSSLMLWQILVAAVIGISFTFRTKILALFFLKWRKRNGDSPPATPRTSKTPES